VGLTGLTGEEHQSDLCATTQSGFFEAEDTRRDRKACIEAKQVAVAGHPSDGEIFKSSKTALEGLVSLVVREGYFRLSVASI
jgi:xylose isomerase